MRRPALQAIEAQATALDAFAIDGIRHNIPFLSALMQHPRWQSGKLSTGFIAEEFPHGFKAPAPEGEVALRMAAVGAAIDHLLNERKRHISGQMRQASSVQFERERVVLLGQERHEVVIEDIEGGFAVVIDGQAWPIVSGWLPGQPVWTGTVGGEEIAVQVRPILNGVGSLPCRRLVGGAGLYQARGGARRPDAGAAGGGYGQAAALPDAGAGEGDQRHGRARRSRWASRSASSRP